MTLELHDNELNANINSLFLNKNNEYAFFDDFLVNHGKSKNIFYFCAINLCLYLIEFLKGDLTMF